MRVAFTVEEDGRGTWKTAEVYAENGKEIIEGEEITLLEKGKKYQGSCKSWNKGKGEGRITPSSKGPWLKRGVKVLQSDLNVGPSTTSLKPGQRLQFQVMKQEDGYTAINVTPPGGRKSTKKENKVQKGENRKRALKKNNKNKDDSASKKQKVTASFSNVVGRKIKPSQLESGTYGGMEIDENDVVEVGLLIRKQYVGGLIGKKGVTIKEIQNFSSANMKFGDEDVEIEGSQFNVFAINGTMNQVADACKMVTEKLGEAAQTLEYKIVFLVPDAFCGMFIGKKGATINEIRGDIDLRVRVILGQNPIELPGSGNVTLCTLFGPRVNLRAAIEQAVAVLGAISERMKRRMDPMDRRGGQVRGGYRGKTRGNWAGRR